MDVFTALRVSAFWSVWNSRKKTSKDDPGYELGRIHRWYARTFHCTIAEAEALPTDHVWQTYWHEHFEDFDEKALEEQRLRMIEDPTDLYVRQIEEDADDAAVFEMGREELERQKAEEQQDSLTRIQRAAEALKELGGVARDTELPVSKAPVTEIPEGIEMSFANEDDVDLDVDRISFGLLDTPKKR